MSTQTENERMDESEQTEEIEVIHKWSQKPPMWSVTSSSEKSLAMLREVEKRLQILIEISIINTGIKI